MDITSHVAMWDNAVLIKGNVSSFLCVTVMSLLIKLS